jgi:2-methylcitrate dehydratase PrpD
MSAPTATARLAAFTSELRFEDLPAGAVAAARSLVLDTLGCTLYAAQLPWSALLQDYVAGDGEATLWGTAHQATAPLAALANGTAGHGFEIDDVELASGLHVGSTVLPPAVALGETHGGVSGADALTAVVAGAEVGIRVGTAIFPGHFLRGYHPQGTVGPIAAAAAAARALGLSPGGAADAFGLAGSMAAGLMGAQQGGMVKRFHAGRAAEGGLVSAELAQAGFTGTADVFDIAFGGYCSTLEGEPGSIERLHEQVEGLGRDWLIGNVGYKAHASCAANHTSLDVASALRRDHDLRAEDVEAVRVTTSRHTYVHCGWDYVPGDVTNAQMSLQYGVAAMLTSGSAFVEQFTEDRIRDPELVELARRVEVVPDDEIDRRGAAFRHTVRVELRTRAGATHAGEAVHRRGSASDPLGADAIVAKFRQLASHIPWLDPDAVIATVDDLESLDDVRALARLLQAPRTAS